ncbi:MAG: DUF1868 domain-containing protein [Granulosicoccus sp.]
MSNKPTAANTEAVNFLTGKLSREPWPSGIALPGEGGKFLSDGTLQVWPGNTFVCHVDAQSPAHDELRALQEEIKMSRFASFFTFLPPSSFHMTVFEGISPGVNNPACLPTGAKPGMSRDELSANMLEKLADVKLEPSQSVEIVSLFCGLGLRVRRVGEQHDAPLRHARERLRTATGINPPRFEEYMFHISLAYLLQWLTEPTAAALVEFSNELAGRYAQKLSAIPLGPVEFCNFESMHHFEPLKRLV